MPTETRFSGKVLTHKPLIYYLVLLNGNIVLSPKDLFSNLKFDLYVS